MTFNRYNIGITSHGITADYDVIAESEGAAGRIAARTFQGEYNRPTWQPTVTRYTLTEKDVQEDA